MAINFPVELLFETYSAFDHLKRYFLDSTNNSKVQKKEMEKAIAHLQRGVLDAFKLKLKYFNDDLEELLNLKIDFSLIDEGKYFHTLLSEKKHIIELAKKARLDEKNVQKEIAFNTWLQVSLAIDEFENKFLDDKKITWAKHKTKQLVNVNRIEGLILGVIASGIVWVLSGFININEFIKNVIHK